MQAKFKFENLEIWQRAMDLGEDITKTADNFPKKENFNLSLQICRAADAVAMNIAEGCIGQQPDLEFRKFIEFAIRSLAEVVTCLHKAKRRNYITNDQFDSYYEEAFDLMTMMTAFKKNIN